MIENVALKIQKLLIQIRSILKINSDNKVINLYKPVFNSPIQPNQRDIVTDEIKKISANATMKPKPVHKVVMGNYLGIVIDPNLSGTTINIEFSISNGKDSPLIIKGVSGELQGTELNLKGFFKLIDEGRQRVPDLSRRFPIIVAPNGADRQEVILENLDKELIAKGDLEGKLLVLTGESEVVQEKFILSVDDSLMKLIKETRDLSRLRGLPFVFDVMIKS